MKYEKSCCRHLFAIGSASYGKMMKDTENQVIVIRSVYPCFSVHAKQFVLTVTF